LRDRVSDRERFRISAFYFQYVTGEMDKAIEAYELWARSYPREMVPHANLGSLYASVGQYDKSITETETAQRLGPTITNYSNLASDYVAVNRIKDARLTLQEAQKNHFDGLFLRSEVYALAFLAGDTAEMERQVTWALGRPGEEDQMLNTHADTQAYYGRMVKARDLARQAADSAVRADAKETAAQWLAFQAIREVEVGNAGAARQAVARALALAPGRDVRVLSALALARAGESTNRKLFWRRSRNPNPATPSSSLLVPRDRSVDGDRATCARPRRHRPRAFPALRTRQSFSGNRRHIASRIPSGLAYLAEKNGPAAAAEFQKLLDHQGIVQNFLLGSLAHLQIGRAYAMSGDRRKAKTAYQDFFALWKDADPDIPILKEAKAEYAKLD